MLLRTIFSEVGLVGAEGSSCPCGDSLECSLENRKDGEVVDQTETGEVAVLAEWLGGIDQRVDDRTMEQGGYRRTAQSSLDSLAVETGEEVARTGLWVVQRVVSAARALGGLAASHRVLEADLGGTAGDHTRVGACMVSLNHFRMWSSLSAPSPAALLLSPDALSP